MNGEVRRGKTVERDRMKVRKERVPVVEKGKGVQQERTNVWGRLRQSRR